MFKTKATAAITINVSRDSIGHGVKEAEPAN